MKSNLLFTAYLSIIVLFFLSSDVFANNDRQNDSTTLVNYYYHTGNILSWDFSKPMDNWEGVTLNQEGRVTGLNVSNNNITHLYGLKNLDALTHLNASFNKLNKLTDDLFQLTNLIELDLSNNNIISDRFEDFMFFPKLQKLYLNNNNFFGEMPEVFSTLDNLNALKLNINPATLYLDRI